ncbi:XRE family transcriptional regulator [Paramesorhizobium deserti]|uniref:Sugar fermentation stimulation protein homolog n=1 Tax=Paramesorhizobium deserti TaxID=1494590 RepID=A0A135HVI2_9HYPH|nr:DNA/RNA nuclease SfsA [Paramesorhizobium deserti]KXF77196.1 XRE family transcriptional regulator [Paramesorhizobium deserti]
MQFILPMVSGRLERRYKRFLADVTLDDGRFITASVPNTGSMLGLNAPGSRVWLSVSDGQKRKYAHALQIVEADGTLVGINTGLPNRIAEEAILAGMLPSLSGYADLKREQRYGRNSRIDILLSDDARPMSYVEVKNVHFMREPGLAEFPDTVTARGAKHLDELGDMVEAGHRGVMLFVIQRNDCSSFRLCQDLDPTYVRAFDRARQRGVEAYAIRCHITPEGIAADCVVPIDERL